MFYDKLKPVPQGHNLKAVRFFAVLLALVAAHLLLIDSELSLLSSKVVIASQWQSAGDFFSWIEQGRVAGVDTAFTSFFVSLLFLLVIALFLHFSCDIINQFLDWVFDKKARTFLFLAALFTAFLRYYFMPGLFTESGDASAHLMQVWIVREALLHHELPVWTNWVYSGAPFLQDYGPFYFYFAGLLSALTSHFDTAVKVALFLFHAASGFTFFYAARSLTRNPKMALTGSLLYILMGWHSHFVLVLGRFPIAPLYVFMPLAFLEAWRLLENGRTQTETLASTLRFSLYFGAMFLCHFIYPLQFGAFLGLFIMLRIALDYRATRDTNAVRAAALRFGLGGLLVLLFVGGYLIPFIVEKGNTMAAFHMENAMGTPRRTFSLFAWFIWNNARFPLLNYPGRQWGDSYFGLSTFLLLAAALFFAWRNRARAPLDPSAKAAGLTLLSLGVVILFWSLWGKLPLFKALYVTECERYQLPFLFFLVMATLLLWRSLLRAPLWNGDKILRIALPAALVIICADLGSLAFQTPYGLKSDWDRNESLTEENRKNYESTGRSVPVERVYYEGQSEYDFTLKGAPMTVRRTCHPAFVGSYAQGAPLSYRYVEKMYPFIKANIEERTDILLPLPLLNFFFQFNAPYLVLNGRKNAPPERIDSVRYFGSEKTLVRLAFHAPLAYSQTLTPVREYAPEKDYIWDLLGRNTIDFRTGRASTLFIKETDPHQSLAIDPAAPFSLEVTAFANSNSSVDLTLRSTAAAYLQLPYSYHPSLTARINGEPAALFPSALNLACIKIEAGESRLRLQGGLSSLRKALLGLNGVMVLLAAGYLLSGMVSRRRKAAAR